MTLQELVDGTRAFIKDCMDASRGQVLSTKMIIPANLLKCIVRLMFSINGTTDSAILLIEEGCVWDSSLLLRSVLDGTARACYLVLSKTQEEEQRRLYEFKDLLPKAEMGGLDQPLAEMMHSPYYKGTEFEEDPVLDPIRSMVDSMKPGEGEGKLLREVKARWNFFKISNVLKEDYPLWKTLAPVFEFRYAIANQLIHKTDMGSRQVLIRYMCEPDYRELSDMAHAVTVLMALCHATLARLVALSVRQNADLESFEVVRQKHKNFFKDAQVVEDAYIAELKIRNKQDC